MSMLDLLVQMHWTPCRSVKPSHAELVYARLKDLQPYFPTRYSYILLWSLHVHAYSIYAPGHVLWELHRTQHLIDEEEARHEGDRGHGDAEDGQPGRPWGFSG